MKKFVAFLAALIMLLSLSLSAYAAPTDGATLRHAVARIYVGVELSVDDKWYEPEWMPLCTGSGFFVGKEGEDPQFMLTNRHVIEDYIEFGKGVDFPAYDLGYPHARAQIRVYFDKTDYEQAYLVEAGDGEQYDLAILRLAEPTSKRTSLPICVPTQSMSDPNKKVFAVGFPGAADNEILKSVSMSAEKDAVITTGTINKISVLTATGVQLLQHDAVIHHGSSGGPLVFENGAAVGLTTWGLDEDTLDVSTTVYYAVGMDTIKPYLDRNNVPYTLIGENDVGTEEKEPEVEPTAPTIPPEPEKAGIDMHNWLIYAILGVAILGIIIVLIVLLRKPKARPVPMPPSAAVTNPRDPVTNPVRILVGVEGVLKEKRYTLEKGKSLYIGRDKGKCKVLFPDKTPGVSNIHCKISFDGKTATITDLKSSYGTTVNGNKLTPNAPTTLHRGLPIDIGSKNNRFTLQ